MKENLSVKIPRCEKVSNQSCKGCPHGAFQMWMARRRAYRMRTAPRRACACIMHAAPACIMMSTSSCDMRIDGWRVIACAPSPASRRLQADLTHQLHWNSRHVPMVHFSFPPANRNALPCRHVDGGKHGSSEEQIQRSYALEPQKLQR